ncbi:MAG: YqgE/AlgH family protein [Tannerellaceae bacterium]|jgi:putative transcriptional regulator|nr:YqgE/AlgH family protein [Tannerellaceae bacterium]
MNNNDSIFTIKHNDQAPSKGSLLIAEPFMKDICFSRSVILLISCDEVGSVGFILNKALPINLNDFGGPFKSNRPLTLCLGGPVEPERVFYIHTLGDIVTDAKPIGGGLYYDGDLQVLLECLQYQKKDVPCVKFFSGYSGWTPELLKQEIEHDSWMVSHASIEAIMAADGESFWRDTLSAMGGKYRLWANYPPNPLLN